MRPAVYSVLWVAALVVALIAGIASLAFVRVDDSRLRTLTSSEIRQRLVGAPVPTPEPQPEPSLPPDGTPTSPRPLPAEKKPEKKGDKEKRPAERSDQDNGLRGFSSSAGSVSASCRDDNAFLVSWSAAPGYRTEKVLRGPAPEVGVRFDKFFDFDAPDVIMVVKCKEDGPRESVFLDRDGRGGDDDQDHDDGPGHGPPFGHDLDD